MSLLAQRNKELNWILRIKLFDHNFTEYEITLWSISIHLTDFHAENYACRWKYRCMFSWYNKTTLITIIILEIKWSILNLSFRAQVDMYVIGYPKRKWIVITHDITDFHKPEVVHQDENMHVLGKPQISENEISATLVYISLKFIIGDTCNLNTLQ
jgi:hypothetical protein